MLNLCTCSKTSHHDYSLFLLYIRCICISLHLNNLIIRYILLKYTTTFQIIHCKICQFLFLDRLNHLVTNSSIDSINWWPTRPLKRNMKILKLLYGIYFKHRWARIRIFRENYHSICMIDVKAILFELHQSRDKGAKIRQKIQF